MSTLRFKVVEEAYGRKAVAVDIPKDRPSDYFGMYVFNRTQMYRYLDRKTYDALVDASILKQTKAQTIYVGKRAGQHALSQEAINQLLIEKGKTSIVVRLKGGDPFVFGRGGEECMALAQAKIPYEVIPGISSAIAVPETMGIPLTHRSVVVLV